MARPTPSDVHINTGLTNISVAWFQDPRKYVAPQVFQRVPVEKQSNKIWEMDQNPWYRRESLLRAPGTESAGGEFTVNSDETYFCDVHAYHKDIADQMLANSDLPGLEIAATKYISQILAIERERDWLTSYFAQNLWADQTSPYDATGSSSNSTWPYFRQFDDGANSDPLGVIRTGKQKIEQTTGFTPNVLVTGRAVHDTLCLHPDIKEVIKYTRLGIADYGLLAQLFELDNYYVGTSISASNIEGASAAYAYNIGDNMLLVYVPESPAWFTPAAGYTFAWTGFNSMGYEVKIKDFYRDELEATRIEGEMAYDTKLLCNELGLYFYDVLS